MMKRAFKFVVPANAGTHTPCYLIVALGQTPFVITNTDGYESLCS
jgi:hypothetical protein